MDNSNINKKRKVIPIIILIISLIIFAAGLLVYPKVKAQWEKPLGPALNLPTYTPAVMTVTDEPSPTNTKRITSLFTDTPKIQLEESSTSAPEATETIAPTSTKEPICGGPPVLYLLGIGVDTKDSSYTYGLADVIRIARVDFVTPKVTVLSIPRDLWIEIPEIEEHGITVGKINQSFFYGTPGMKYYEGPGQGPGLLARTIDHNFKLRVNHYGALNMLTFERIINAVGGIDVYLPTDVDGTPTDRLTDDMGYFYAGQHHFNGDEAVRFSRIRKRYSDYARVDNQNLVLCALREKLLSPKVLPKIPQIIASFQDTVLTDLSLGQITQLACLLPYVEGENLIFSGLPPEIFEHGRVFSPQMKKETFATVADKEVIQDYFQQFQAGTWPSQPDEPSCP